MASVPQISQRRWTKYHLALAAGAVVLIAGLVFVATKVGWLDAIDAAIAGLQKAGPGIFFVAMAILPAVGFPMSAFMLTVGPVFGTTLGAGWVIIWSLTAVTINLLLSYWLADRALRPLVGRLLNYFSFRLPDGATGSAWQISLIVRVTPGPPYWVQSYLLGLLRVPLVPYLVVSLSVMAGYIVALVFGGEAIAEGSGRLAVVAVGILAATVVALQLVRKWLAQRREADAQRK
jgi:uncharacterized membrane protein YdjX (TVP38/TMEM64 family)